MAPKIFRGSTLDYVRLDPRLYKNGALHLTQQLAFWGKESLSPDTQLHGLQEMKHVTKKKKTRFGPKRVRYVLAAPQVRLDPR